MDIYVGDYNFIAPGYVPKEEGKSNKKGARVVARLDLHLLWTGSMMQYYVDWLVRLSIKME